MKFVVSALKSGSIYRFDSEKKAREFMVACFEKMTLGSHDSFVLIETKGA